MPLGSAPNTGEPIVSSMESVSPRIERSHTLSSRLSEHVAMAIDNRAPWTEKKLRASWNDRMCPPQSREGTWI